MSEQGEVRKGPQGEYIRSPEIEGMMQTTGLCPFCNARQGIDPRTRVVYIRRGAHGIARYYVRCWMCGGCGPEEVTAAEAIESWGRRPSKQWTPLSDHAFILPDPQRYGDLMVLDDGKTVKFLDWVDDTVQSEVEIKLGHFRICLLR